MEMPQRIQAPLERVAHSTSHYLKPTSKTERRSRWRPKSSSERLIRTGRSRTRLVGKREENWRGNWYKLYQTNLQNAQRLSSGIFQRGAWAIASRRGHSTVPLRKRTHVSSNDHGGSCCISGKH